MDGINVKNLYTLASYLLSAEAEEKEAEVDFDMAIFSQTDLPWVSLEINCGTSGCAVGWAPFAGIKKRRGEDWHKFSCRSLIDASIQSEKWLWCFDAAWCTVKSFEQRRFAAQRIIYFLLNPNKVEEAVDLDNVYCLTSEDLHKVKEKYGL